MFSKGAFTMETLIRRKHKNYSAAEKALLVDTYKTSGLSCKQWCTENHIGLSTLQRWMREDWKQKTSQPQQTWIPVVTTTEKKVEILSVQAGPFTIPVAVNTDMKLLVSVLGVIRELC
jgi:transposase-like protein